MSKAIFVIDKPENCADCFFFSDDAMGTCDATYQSTEFKEKRVKPDWCPLKEMPEKADLNEKAFPTNEYYHKQGWNTCIDAILTGCGDDWYA